MKNITDKYRKVIYRCVHKYDGGCKCGTPHLVEQEIKEFFLKALNRLLGVKEEVMSNLNTLIEITTDTAELEGKKEKLWTELSGIEDTIKAMIGENARKAIDQEEYDKRYDSLYGRYEKHLARISEIEEEILSRNARRIRIRDFIDKLMDLDGEQTVFDEQLWGGIVDHMTVYRQKKIVFTFAGDIEITVK